MWRIYDYIGQYFFDDGEPCVGNDPSCFEMGGALPQHRTHRGSVFKAKAAQSEPKNLAELATGYQVLLT